MWTQGALRAPDESRPGWRRSGRGGRKPRATVMTERQRGAACAILRRQIMQTRSWAGVTEEGRHDIVTSDNAGQLTEVLYRLRRRDLEEVRRQIRVLLASALAFELSHEERGWLDKRITHEVVSADWRVAWYVHEALRLNLSQQLRRSA